MDFIFYLNGTRMKVNIERKYIEGEGYFKRVKFVDHLNYMDHYCWLHRRKNKTLWNAWDKKYFVQEVTATSYAIEWFKQMILERDHAKRWTTLNYCFYAFDTKDYYFTFATSIRAKHDDRFFILNYNIEKNEIRLFLFTDLEDIRKRQKNKALEQ